MDLIDRQAAIIQLSHNKIGNDDCDVIIQRDIETIKQLSPVQPEIICCKDCQYWDTSWQNDYAPDYHYCPMIDETRRSDFYCADAERKATE